MRSGAGSAELNLQQKNRRTAITKTPTGKAINHMRRLEQVQLGMPFMQILFHCKAVFAPADSRFITVQADALGYHLAAA
jgi:hypothetical protein